MPPLVFTHKQVLTPRLHSLENPIRIGPADFCKGMEKVEQICVLSSILCKLHLLRGEGKGKGGWGEKFDIMAAFFTRKPNHHGITSAL